MRYFLTCGGTAGHINPAIAIADKISELDKESEIVFVGSSLGMENALVPREGYPIWNLDVQGFKRSLSLKNVGALIKMLGAIRGAREMIKRFSPDAVIGTGAYVCFPLLYAASGMGIFTALHESNASPGLAVKLLKHRVDRIYTGFAECSEALNVGERAVAVGNPLKGGFEAVSREEARKRLGLEGRYAYLILSFGGSLGARAVNDYAIDIMEKLTSKRRDVLHLHACGKRESAEFMAEIKRRGLDKFSNISVSEYIYDMPTVMRAADIVLCRSGAMTLAEISCAECPAILIPSPNVTGDHQMKNAIVCERAGAAFLVNERIEKGSEMALEYVITLLRDKQLRESMAKKSALMSKKDASERIAEEIIARVK